MHLRTPRILNAVFLACFVAATCSVGISKTASLLGAGELLPEWMGIGKQESYLEGSAYQNLPYPTFDSILGGGFQSNFESFLSDAVPARDSILLANAALQRKAIELSNGFFRFPAYPTFYGSEFVYIPSDDTITCFHDSHGSDYSRYLPAFVEAVNSFAKEHPNQRIVVFNAEVTWLSENDPLYPLTSEPLDNDFVSKNLFDKLDPSVVGIDLRLDDSSSFNEDFFRTDHHWNIFGASKELSEN